MEAMKEVVKLDDREVTLQELNEAKQDVKSPQKIVEVSPGVYKTLTRLQE